MLFTGKHLNQSLFLNKVAVWGLQLYKRETLAQRFSYEFSEILKTLQVAASLTQNYYLPWKFV